MCTNTCWKISESWVTTILVNLQALPPLLPSACGLITIIYILAFYSSILTCVWVHVWPHNTLLSLSIPKLVVDRCQLICQFNLMFWLVISYIWHKSLWLVTSFLDNLKCYVWKLRHPFITMNKCLCLKKTLEVLECYKAKLA